MRLALRLIHSLQARWRSLALLFCALLALITLALVGVGFAAQLQSPCNTAKAEREIRDSMLAAYGKGEVRVLVHCNPSTHVAAVTAVWSGLDDDGNPGFINPTGWLLIDGDGQLVGIGRGPSGANPRTAKPPR